MAATTEQKSAEEAQVDIEKVVDDLKERVSSRLIEQSSQEASRSRLTMQSSMHAQFSGDSGGELAAW